MGNSQNGTIYPNFSGQVRPAFAPSPHFRTGRQLGVQNILCERELPLDLHECRDKYFSLYDRGLLTASEVNNGFVELMLDAPTADAALALCDGLPDWFRDNFRAWFAELADRDFAYRWFGIGDTRTPEEVEADARRHQAFLKRMADDLLARR